MISEIISLKEFFKTSRLGPIHLGLTQAALRELWGEPDDQGGTSRKYRKPALWKYGDIEFCFDRQTWELDLILLNFWEPVVPSGGRAINLDPWVIHGGMEPNDLLTHFQQERWSYWEVEPFSPGTRHFVVNSTVTLVFVPETEENWYGMRGLRKVYASHEDGLQGGRPALHI
ncbi:MAG: hypothetical protein K1Y36_29340 [Blastocatellia bacterium]|nr:hypothetical protein [Blastocatellia bacterium]